MKQPLSPPSAAKSAPSAMARAVRVDRAPLSAEKAPNLSPNARKTQDRAQKSAARAVQKTQKSAARAAKKAQKAQKKARKSAILAAKDPFSPERVPKLLARGLTKKIEFRGKNVEILLERLRARNIPVLGLKRGESCLLQVRWQDYAKVFAILRAMCYTITKTSAGGPFRYAYFALLRAGAAVGALCFLLSLRLFSPLVLSVKVEGSAAYRGEEIAAALSEMGVSPLRFVSETALKNAERGVLSEFPSFHFVSVQKRGYTVTVRAEVTPKEPSVLASDRLVSDRAGRVASVKVLRGRATVAVGEEVAAGDLLAEGVLVAGESEHPTFVAAEIVLHCGFSRTYRYQSENPALLTLLLETAKAEVGAEALLTENSRMEPGEDGVIYTVEFTYAHCVRGGI